jgi:hypothetical protein
MPSRAEPALPIAPYPQSPVARAYAGVEAEVRLDELESEFASEDTLPRRPPRPRQEDAALDAFELEGVAAPIITDPPSIDVADAPPSVATHRRRFTLPTWQAIAATVLIAGGTILGLMSREPGTPPLADASRESAVTAIAEKPATPAASVAVLETRPGATPVPQVPAPSQLPERRTAATTERGEATGFEPVSALAGSATVTEITPATATTGNSLVQGLDLTVSAGVGELLPRPANVPERLPAAAASPVASGEDSARKPEIDTIAVAPPAPTELAREEINAVLDQFQAAYTRLDAAFVQAIWPSVDRPRLERAFRNLASQDLEFGECRLDLVSATAAATCTGAVSYVTRVGSRRAHDTRTWTFTLRKAPEGWRIQDVLMR